MKRDPQDDPEIGAAGLFFVTWGKERFPAQPGETLLEVLRPGGLAADCGGRGTCGQCRLLAFPREHLSLPTAEEGAHLGKEEMEAGWRLACQAGVWGDIEVKASRLASSLSRRPEATPSWMRADGCQGKKTLGLAVDLGTTNITCYLADLKQKKIIGRRTSANPQLVYGTDVVARIAYAAKSPEALEILRNLAAQKINELVRELLFSVQAAPGEVAELVLVGNTAMQQIFSAVNPASLGFWPYAPAYLNAREGRAQDFGLDFSGDTPIFVFPVISGYLGGDALGATFSQGLWRRRKLTLLIDVGTNGEVILGAKGSLWGTSCATGPAFEGAHLSNGMAAAAGAISQFRLRKEKHGVRIITIDGAPPRGICGSGLVDILAELRRHGLLRPDGLLTGSHPRLREAGEGKERRFLLVPGQGGQEQGEIAVTQGDIREVQLAKAALASGIALLEKEAALGRPEKIILTGAFGTKFNRGNALAIGLLPAWARLAKITVKENAAAYGALKVLFDPAGKKLLEKLASRIYVVNLAAHPLFMETYTENLAFP